MRLPVLTLFLFGSLAACDNTAETKTENNVNTPINSDSTEVDVVPAEVDVADMKEEKKTWMIFNEGCQLVSLGEPIGDLGDGFKVKYISEVRMEEGEEYSIDMAIVSENETKLLECELDGSGESNANVTGIFIHSNRFETVEGIRVGSTREEFVETYPDYKLWYTYVGDFTTFETSDYGSVQFRLNMVDYLPELTFDSDMEMLEPGDFSKGAEINVIRIY